VTGPPDARRGQARRNGLTTLMGASAVALLASLPLAFLLLQVLGVPFRDLQHLLLRPRVGELLGNTLRLVGVVTGASVLIGAAAAWLTERTDLRAVRAWRVALVLPIAVPEFVNGYTWVSISPHVQGLWGASLVSTLSLYPLVYLPVAAMLRARRWEQDEVAGSLGLSPLAVFIRVVVPQLRPALVGGAVIVCLHLLGEYGSFALLRFPTFAVAIFDQYKLGFDAASAAGLSLVLVALCMLVLAVQRRATGGPVGTTGRTDPGRARPLPLGRASIPCQCALFGLALLSLGVPLFTTGRWLVRGASTTLPPASTGVVLINTLLLGLSAAVVCAVLALPVAFMVVRRAGRLSAVVSGATYINRALPGVVVALALVFFSLRTASGLYQSNVLVILAYVALFLPLSVVAVTAGVSQLPTSLPEVAASLGASKPVVWWRIGLPLLLPSLSGAVALVFLSTVTELTATLLLHPTGVQTLATQFWLYTTGQAYGAAAPYAGLMLVLAAGPTYLLTRQFDRPRLRVEVL
jgi:iron(III) transport system permease protein